MNAAAKRHVFAERLLGWGGTNWRDYPWRKTREPFSVLVAELMLQRTNAEQVIPVYNKFLKQFPDVKKLSSSSTEEILDIIKSLGLEYRVTRFKNIAENILIRHSGIVPEDSESLLDLDGVGKYVANATRCFAYNHDVAIVDANIARIVKRVFSLDFGRDPHKRIELWKFAESLVPKGKAREYNWALLDFGRLLCTPKNPKCKQCPLKDICDFGKTVK